MGDSGHELVFHRVQFFQSGDVTHDRHTTDSPPVAVGYGCSTGVKDPSIRQRNLLHKSLLVPCWLGEELF